MRTNLWRASGSHRLDGVDGALCDDGFSGRFVECRKRCTPTFPRKVLTQNAKAGDLIVSGLRGSVTIGKEWADNI
jgi:hypothetical protein